jgi:outer membrane murein-binding lipoprotein Lpp
MSTAGKTLVILFLLASLVWIVLAAGVAQLNTNANTKLHELTQQVEKLEVGLKQTRDEIVAQRNETSQVEEEIDRTATLLRARQVDIEKARSQILEGLYRVQYQLAIVQDTIKGAQTALANRNTEQQEETTELAKMRSDVKTLMAECSQLRERLATLRKDFQTTYRSNLEMLGKFGRSDDARRGVAN